MCPVSRDKPDLEQVKANADTWININANPNWEKRQEPFMTGNNIAGVGGAWNNTPRGHADYHYNANSNHGGPGEVLPIP